MNISFESKIVSEPQILNINKESDIITLIGKNGSGKSSILESIFEKYIDNDTNKRIIAFSSGQNELFSNLFIKHKRESNRYLAENNAIIRSFYFNSDWLKLLVFWSSILKSEGRVREYLKENNYIKINEFEDDITSKLHFKFRIRKAYVQKIKAEAEREIRSQKYGGEEYLFNENLYRKTYFHETLERIIDIFNIDFDFLNKENLIKRSLFINSEKVFKIFTHKEIDKIFSFWALATNGWLANFDWKDFLLEFEKGLNFHSLSDGEYQLLSIYALIDLFDDPDTIFLLDEADSHLYYENLIKMWQALKETKGTVLTTTHLSESILQNDFKNIKLVENGIIKNNIPFGELSKRLDMVIGDRNYKFKILSRVEYPVLIDNINDWEIFRRLAVKKLGKEAINILDKFLPISISSGFSQNNVVFGKSKLEFVKKFKEKNKDKEILTKKIFLICDRDEYNGGINDNLTVNIHSDYKNLKKFNSKKTSTHLLSWKRREIENYLLSSTLIIEKKLKNEIHKKYNLPKLKIGDNLDTVTDIRQGDFKDLIHPLYNDSGSGFNDKKLQELIDIIPSNEISEDITILYDFLKETY